MSLGAKGQFMQRLRHQNHRIVLRNRLGDAPKATLRYLNKSVKMGMPAILA